MAKRTSKTKQPSKILVLRTCNADLSSHEGFQWPDSGAVVAPDWDPDPTINCGGGLHGLAWGDGDWSLLLTAADAKWLVVEVDAADLVPSADGTKVRFRAGAVVYCGTEAEAVCRVMCGPENTARIAALAGKKNSASGHSGHASASGYAGIAASLGNQGTVRAGPNGLLIACWWDSDAKRYHACAGEVGVDGIKANTDYKVVDGKLTEVKP